MGFVRHACAVAKGERGHGVVRLSRRPVSTLAGSSAAAGPTSACCASTCCYALRFEVKCATNDIVLSTSADGVAWSAVSRVPIDAVGSGVDHFIPGLGVDPATSGSAAHLALTYYYYPNAACTTATCQLDVGYISSPNGGATWGTAAQQAGPMSLTDIASTSQGPMVGDYISTSFNSAGAAVPVFAIGNRHTTAFDEAMYTSSTPLAVATATAATNAASSAGVQVQAAGQGVRAAHEAVRER
jgi:hypothetical protein